MPPFLKQSIINALLILGASLPGCPTLLTENEDFGAFDVTIEILSLDTNLDDCKILDLEIQIATSIEGLDELNDLFISDLVIHSPSGDEISSTVIGDGHFSIAGIPAGFYLLDFTLRSDTLLNSKLGRLDLPIRKFLRVENPEQFTEYQLTFSNASTAGSLDGSACIDWKSDEFEPTFVWSTGDTTTCITHLPPGNYSVSITNLGLQTCPLVRGIKIGVNAPIIVQDSFSLTPCPKEGVTANYSSSCDDRGLQGENAGEVEFDFGLIQFAQLTLSSIMQIDLKINNTNTTQEQILFRGVSSTNVLAEGTIPLPEIGSGPRISTIRIPLIDFVLAGRFDVDFSFRLFVRAGIFLQSIKWVVIEEQSNKISITRAKINDTSPLNDTILACQADSFFLGHYFDVQNGSTPYQYWWDLDDDHVFESSDTYLLDSEPGMQIVRLLVLDAYGDSAQAEVTLNIKAVKNYALYAEKFGPIPRDSFLIVCSEDDPLVLVKAPNQVVIEGPGLINNTFDPSLAGVGLHTLSVGSLTTCEEPAYLKIYVDDVFDPSWQSLDTYFCDQPVFLDSLITGDLGGLWMVNGEIWLDSMLDFASYEDDTVNFLYGYGIGPCNRFEQRELVINCTRTAVEEYSPMEITVFPNPTHDYLQIIDDQKSIIQKIKIFDAFGNIIQKKRSEEIKSGQINLTDLSSGVYLLQMVLENDLVSLQKIILL